MGIKKTKKAKNAAFKKVKVKVGKTLKKTATTDTTFKAKKIVLTSQLKDNKEESGGGGSSGSGVALSYRGLSVDDLCKQLGHFNKNMRKDAVMGCKQLLTSRPDLLQTQMRTLIPSIGRLIADPEVDSAFHSQLRALLELVCSVPSSAMSAHFQLFLAHTLRALTHLQNSVRTFALSVLKILMKSYKDLCRNNMELFDSVTHYLKTSKKPAWNTKGFLECVDAFVSIYDMGDDDGKPETIEITVDCKDGTCTRLFDLTPSGNPFDVRLMGSSNAGGAASPFELPEAILRLSGVIAPIVYTALAEDTSGQFLVYTLSIITSMGRAIERQPNAFLVPNFNKDLGTIWDAVRKTAAKKKGETIRKATGWLIEL